MDKEQLAEILDSHGKWLRGEGGSRADLSGADLRSADLRSADLSLVDLSFVDLRRADLRSANLSHLDLRDANLRSANLSHVDLSGADLSHVDLRSTNLSGADLSHNDYVISCTLTNFSMLAFMYENLLCVTSGCRRGLTIAEAREHWSPNNKHAWTEKKEAWGAQRLRMIDFLEAEASHLGWIK